MDNKEFLSNARLSPDFSPRDYQVNAAAEVLEKGNCLVVMPTALGKTYVAFIVMAKMLASNPDAKFLFLAPTKPLAAQQAKRASEMLQLDAARIITVTGEVPKERRVEAYADARAIFATPQTIEHDLDVLDINSFSLIVFDEAHRTVGNYAYANIAKKVHSDKALLLGLTASPSSDSQKIAEICSLLAVKHVVARNEQDDDVAQYVNEITVEWLPVDLTPALIDLRRTLLLMSDEAYSPLKRVDFLGLTTSRPNKTQLLAARSRLMGWSNPAKYKMVSLLAKLMNILHAIDLLESQGISALYSCLTGFEVRRGESKAVAELASDPRISALAEKADALLSSGVEHPKLFKLVEIVKGYRDSSKSIIVFAHYRDSVKTLVSRLNAQGIDARPLVGRSGEGMSQKEQVAVLEQFRQKEFPVIVGTSVMEEGIDVPAADAVIFYDAVPSEVRAIQRRGRTGRVREGKAFILYTRGTKDEAYHWSSRSKERKMHDEVEKLKHNIPAFQQRLG